MPTITVHVLAFNYNEFGAENKGTPVLLVHGLGSQSKWMEPLARFLVDTYKLHVFTPDLAGFGRSGRREDKPETDQSYSIESHAKDIIGFLDALKISKVILLGHSMGGMIAQIVAKTVPDRVEKLILLATGTFLRLSRIELALAKLAPLKPVLFNAFRRALPKDYPKDKLEEQVISSLENTSRVAYVRSLEQLTKKHFFSEPWLQDLKVPTLVIGCEEDRSIGFDASKTLQSRIPGAILYTIKGGNHEAQVLHTKEVGTAIGKFIGV